MCCVCVCVCVCVYMRGGGSEGGRKGGTEGMYMLTQSTRQGKSKATTPEDNSFSREKEELLRAGFEPATLCILGRRSTN